MPWGKVAPAPLILGIRGYVRELNDLFNITHFTRWMISFIFGTTLHGTKKSRLYCKYLHTHKYNGFSWAIPSSIHLIIIIRTQPTPRNALFSWIKATQKSLCWLKAINSKRTWNLSICFVPLTIPWSRWITTVIYHWEILYIYYTA